MKKKSKKQNKKLQKMKNLVMIFNILCQFQDIQQAMVVFGDFLI